MSNIELISLILLLLVINFFFAISEFAIATSRKIKLQQLVTLGDKRANEVISIMDSPTKFITVIQIGLNLVAILSGVFAEERLTVAYESILVKVIGEYQSLHWISFTLSILSLTSIFIIYSELIPKKIAFSEPERIACKIVRPLTLVMKLFNPLVKLLSTVSNITLKILKINTARDENITYEEVSAIISEGAQSGILELNEHKILKNVLNLTERGVATAITSRNDIIYFDIHDEQEDIVNKILEHPHARFIVSNGELENILGYIESRDILKNLLQNKEIKFNKENLKINGLKPILTLPDSLNLLDVLDKFSETRQDIACVINEFGMLLGITTLSDVLNTIVGDVVSIENEDSLIVKRNDNSWIVDGKATIESVKEILGWEYMEGEENYETISGFLMYQVKTIPKKTQKIIIKDTTFEVIDVEGFRIDDILVTQEKRD